MARDKRTQIIGMGADSNSLHPGGLTSRNEMVNNTLYIKVRDPDGTESWRRVRGRRPTGRASYTDR